MVLQPETHVHCAVELAFAILANISKNVVCRRYAFV